MNNPKNIRPHLVNPELGKKIVKTLYQPEPDYWAPTKSGLTTIYESYIRPNIVLIVIIIIIIILLCYRYRVVKMKRDEEAMTAVKEPKKDVQPYDPKQEMNDTAELLMYYYQMQKDTMREPLKAKRREMDRSFMDGYHKSQHR